MAVGGQVFAIGVQGFDEPVFLRSSNFNMRNFICVAIGS